MKINISRSSFSFLEKDSNIMTCFDTENSPCIVKKLPQRSIYFYPSFFLFTPKKNEDVAGGRGGGQSKHWNNIGCDGLFFFPKTERQFLPIFSPFRGLFSLQDFFPLFSVLFLQGIFLAFVVVFGDCSGKERLSLSYFPSIIFFKLI